MKGILNLLKMTKRLFEKIREIVFIKGQNVPRQRERDEETKKGSARTPSLLRRIILRLGCVTP